MWKLYSGLKPPGCWNVFFGGGGGQGGFYPFGPFSFIDGTTVVRTKGCLGGPPEGVPKHVSVHQI
jgi:hypothetical protein